MVTNNFLSKMAFNCKKNEYEGGLEIAAGGLISSKLL